MKGKHLVSSVLALVLVMAMLSGCSSATATPAATTTKAGTAAATTAAATTEKVMEGNMYVKGFPVLKDKVTYTIAVSKDANSMNSFNDKQCVLDTEKLTNIHIDWMDIPSSGWNEQVNIMLASGNMPDAFCGQAVDTMKNIELFTPIKEYIYDYAPNIVEMLTTDAAILKAITAPDGEIYGLPTNKDNPSDSVGPILWMNGEWLKKVGKTMPTTTDEFTAVLRDFKTKDPNGNGKADEIPFVSRQGSSSNALDTLMGSFGAVDNSRYVYSADKKTVVFSGKQQGYFEALKWLHMLYAEKLLDNEVFSMDASQLIAKAKSPDLVIGSLMHWIPDSMDPRFTNYIPMAPLKGPTGTQMWTKNATPLGTMQGYAITTACEDPEVLVRYYDSVMSSFEMVMNWQWGPEFAGTWKRAGANDAWSQTMEYVPAGTSQEQFKRTVCGSVQSPMYLWSKWTGIEVPDARNALKRVGNNLCMPFAVEPMPNGLDDPEKANARNLLFTDIDNYMKKFKATAVVDGITDAQWATHLATLDKLKVDQYVSLWQEYYTRVMK